MARKSKFVNNGKPFVITIPKNANAPIVQPSNNNRISNMPNAVQDVLDWRDEHPWLSGCMEFILGFLLARWFWESGRHRRSVIREYCNK